jgi:hypothetical protein
MQSYNSRLQTLTSSPESFMNIKKSLSVVDSEPILKAQVQQRRLFSKDYIIANKKLFSVVSCQADAAALVTSLQVIPQRDNYQFH